MCVCGYILDRWNRFVMKYYWFLNRFINFFNEHEMFIVIHRLVCSRKWNRKKNQSTAKKMLAKTIIKFNNNNNKILKSHKLTGLFTAFSRSWATQLFKGLLFISGFFSASHFELFTVSIGSFLSRYLRNGKKSHKKEVDVNKRRSQI